MSDTKVNYGQNFRPEWERNLSEWERSALDQRRKDEIRNRNENPAIWAKLTEIEAKLDHIFALLVSLKTLSSPPAPGRE